MGVDGSKAEFWDWRDLRSGYEAFVIEAFVSI